MSGILEGTLGDTLPAVAPERIVRLRDGAPRDGGRYVLYWMQSSQRPWDNPALNLAIISADRLRLPVLVCFALTGYPEATVRHYTFMLEGIAETARLLGHRGMEFVMRCGEPWRFALELAGNAALVVTDGAYLPLPRSWRAALAENIDCPLYEVESDVVVPVRLASDKREFAARTIRRKLHRHVEQFLHEPVNPEPAVRAPEAGLAGTLEGLLDPSDPRTVVNTVVVTYAVDTSVPPVSRLYPGG
ncbi:MAG: deoxyribodipyrimidine photo-lyase, partial [Spirochaetia bacterium]